MTGDDRAYLREVGMRVRVARVRRRISQDQLAEIAAVSRVSLGSIERGEHAAGLITYRKIAGALGVAMGDLLDAERS